MAKKRNYNEELRKIQIDVCNEIEKELKRIGRDFTEKDEDDIEFFQYSTCTKNDIIGLRKDGDVVIESGQSFSIQSAVFEETIPLCDAISILEDLRNIL